MRLALAPIVQAYPNLRGQRHTLETGGTRFAVSPGGDRESMPRWQSVDEHTFNGCFTRRIYRCSVIRELLQRRNRQERTARRPEIRNPFDVRTVDVRLTATI